MSAMFVRRRLLSNDAATAVAARRERLPRR